MFFCRKRKRAAPTPVGAKAIRFNGNADEIERFVGYATVKEMDDGRIKIQSDGNTEYVSVGNYVVVMDSGYVKSYTASDFNKEFGEQVDEGNGGMVSLSLNCVSNTGEDGMRNQIINAVSCVITGATSVGVCLAPVDLYVKVMVIGVCAFAVIWTTLNAALGKSR